VRIDLLRSCAASFGRALFDLFSMVAVSTVVVLIAIKSWPVVERSLTNGSRANTTMETPLALVQIPWFACMSCLVTLCVLSLIVKRRNADTESFADAFAEQDRLQ
jgi:TRAP-type C4-dicarboxylate transport system permease small subunit